jgi:hypothetical protein
MAPTPPTYRETAAEGRTTYVCLYCEEMASEHHATDLALFTLHMAQAHDGRMVKEEAPPEETPA